MPRWFNAPDITVGDPIESCTLKAAAGVVATGRVYHRDSPREESSTAHGDPSRTQRKARLERALSFRGRPLHALRGKPCH